jgi:hypothetical protein
MTRRFEIGPILMAVGALVLLVSLFLDWYGGFTAWSAFEVVDVLLALLVLLALVAAVGLLAPDLAYVDRRWLPAVVFVIVALVAAEIISPPPAVGDADPDVGAWLAFGAAVLMLLAAVLSLGRVSFSFAVEGRDMRRRVPAVDHRQPTTESGAIVAPPPAADETATTVADSPAVKPPRGRRR